LSSSSFPCNGSEEKTEVNTDIEVVNTNEIAGAGENTLYIQKGSKVYSINLKEGPGAQPMLVTDLENNDTSAD
jgi:hypothetical protein